MSRTAYGLAALVILILIDFMFGKQIHIHLTGVHRTYVHLSPDYYTFIDMDTSSILGIFPRNAVSVVRAKHSSDQWIFVVSDEMKMTVVDQPELGQSIFESTLANTDTLPSWFTPFGGATSSTTRQNSDSSSG